MAMPPRLLTDNPRQVFLIDGLGAMLSAILLLVVICYHEFFGMPVNILYRLIPFPILFSGYSIVNYFLYSKNWKAFLSVIAAANTIYCLVTIGLVIYYFHRLTIAGTIYFLAESIVILFIAGIEFLLVFSKAGSNRKLS